MYSYYIFLSLLHNGKIMISDENGAKKVFVSRSAKKRFGGGGVSVCVCGGGGGGAVKRG